ncbi:hypothetical protein ACLBXX_00555 [Microbacterium sp. C23T]
MIAANGRLTHADAHLSAAAARYLVELIGGTDVILEDTIGNVLNEYKNYMQFSGQPGVGDYFFRWYLQNRWDGRRVGRVELDPAQPLTQYLPASLHSFDPSDHKWIAVYIQGSADVIVNATDSDWAESRELLLEHSIKVRELSDEN